MKNGLTKSLLFFFFLKMPKIWLGGTKLNGEKIEDGHHIKIKNVQMFNGAWSGHIHAYGLSLFS